jgi:hypothetical protein
MPPNEAEGPEASLPSPNPDLPRILRRDVSQKPDAPTGAERQSLENEKLKEEVRGLQQDTAERKKYAQLFFGLSVVWIAIITLILLLEGFGSFWFGRMLFKLSDPVMLAVIGSTTVNVLGILYVVANYLFPKR